MEKIKEELGQKELFDPAMMAGKGISNEKMEPYVDKYKKMGFKAADSIVDRITSDVARMLTSSAGNMDIDLEANTHEAYDDSTDMMMDSDAHMEMVLELSQAYLEGMTRAWPFPVGFDTDA